MAATSRLGCFNRVVARWRAAINYLVPIGYEDDSGFHYGQPAARNRRNSETAS